MADRYLVTPTAVLPGQSSPAFPEISEHDIPKVGRYALEGDARIVDDFITDAGVHICVFGGDYQIAGGLVININKPLRAWRAADGRQFSEMDADTEEVELSAAHATLPRIDLVYVTLEEDQDAAQETRHFKQDPADPASAEGDLSVYTEKHNRLTVHVSAGTPAANPAAAALPASSAPLYEITVGAAVTQLTGDAVKDVRRNFDNLEKLNRRVSDLENDLNEIGQQEHRHRADMVDADAPANALGSTVQVILNNLVARADASTVDPIFRPEVFRKGQSPLDLASGKVGATGGTDGGTGVVNIKTETQVSFFGTATRVLSPASFPAQVEGVSINARLRNIHGDQATQSRSNTIQMLLSQVAVEETDGAGLWILESFQLPVTRHRKFEGQRLAAARDSRFVELMGGAPLSDGDSAWYTVDTVSETVSQATFTGDIPNGFIRGVFPFGDGTHVLVAMQVGADFGQNGGKLEWFKVNCLTRASVKLTGTIPGASSDPVGPGPCGVIGDLISPGIIFLAVNAPGVTSGAQYWVYKSDLDQFELVNPIGQNPLSGLALNTQLAHVDMCCYRAGQAILVRGHSGIATHIFDYATRTWTELQIAQPAADQLAVYGSTLFGLSLANINGRVQLVSDTSSVWEITPGTTPRWSIITSQVAPRGLAGIVGMIKDGLPRGEGVILGGAIRGAAKQDVWRFESGGIIETADGLCLGGSTRQATFRVNSIQLPWVVGKVYASPVGSLPLGSIRIQYSFDGGQTRIDVPRDTITTVPASSANPTPIVWVTLIGTESVRPCIKSLNELFEQVGGPGLVETVITFNVITAGVRYVYLSREGAVTIETTAQPTTPDKALLLKVTPAGSSAPTVFEYVNQRFIHRKYTATRASGSTPSIANELPVLPRYVRGFLKEASGNLKDLADPTVVFNQSIVVAGLSADGESYIVEIVA